MSIIAGNLYSKIEKSLEAFASLGVDRVCPETDMTLIFLGSSADPSAGTAMPRFR